MDAWGTFLSRRAASPGFAIHRAKLNERNTMLNWAVTFLIIALIAAVLGFGNLAGTATEIAKILFFVFIVLFILSFFLGRRGPGTGPVA
jgi:uncharacterized membrane protein YtjA (UPF0391 family)